MDYPICLGRQNSVAISAWIAINVVRRFARILDRVYIRPKKRIVADSDSENMTHLARGRVLRRWILRPSVLRNLARCFFVT